jgi:hypothetical protein
MSRLAIAALLLGGCLESGRVADRYDGEIISLSGRVKLEVTTDIVRTDDDGFGEPRFVVALTAFDSDACLRPEESFGGAFRGVPMTVIQRGGPSKNGCLAESQLAIDFRAVDPTTDTIEVHDATGSLTATYEPGVLDIRTATSDWTFKAGTTSVLEWSHPVFNTMPPEMSFVVPSGDSFRVWDRLTGSASARSVSFTLPAQVQVTGTGEAFIETDHVSGLASQCTAIRCAYDLDYFVIHSATVNP